MTIAVRERAFDTLADIGYRVLGDRVVVRPDNPAFVEHLADGTAKRESGLIVPDTAIESTYCGTVVGRGDGEIRVAVGPNGEAVLAVLPMPVEVGNRVHHSMYGTTKMEIDGEVFLSMRIGDVIAVMPGSAD